MTNQAFPSEDGNFKRGAFKPVAILIGVLLVGGAAAFAFLGVQHESATLTKDEVNKEVREIQLLPKTEQLPRWRKWADVETEPRLEQEAFVHLAWAKDQASIPAMIKGLASPDHAVRGTAAMALVDFGSPAADNAKPVLLKALLEADDSDSVRQLVATTLSTDADPKWTDTLIKLVQDPSVEIAREAAVGLGKIASEKAMQPLVDALSRADKESREKFLQALRDGVGANGLVLALKTVNHDKPDTEKFQTRQIFEMLKELEDPRGGEALYAYIQTNPKPHWKNEAAMRLAEIGDVRAAEALGGG